MNCAGADGLPGGVLARQQALSSVQRGASCARAAGLLLIATDAVLAGNLSAGRQSESLSEAPEANTRRLICLPEVLGPNKLSALFREEQAALVLLGYFS